MGGEKLWRRRIPGSNEGSPPRRRGKDWSRKDSAPLSGITPAWAGKRPARHHCTGQARDHPRVGGEKAPEPPGVLAPPGSPPHRRGKGQASGRSCGGQGITPAWAGKSHILKRDVASRRDHPRAGGEKWAGVEDFMSYIGSPPRGRGKEKMVTLQDINARITPAWAGKRHSCRMRRWCSGDHPRVGGEKV